jgi:NAD(P)-dependent dehydrogenase (short-subunit alcohol dehydrogenase family)
MDLQLKDKRAVVTGSTAGIGFAIAHALALEGASVVVNGRTRERVTSAVNEIRRHAPQANIRGIAADLSTPAGIATLLTDTPEAEILVNNLGIFEAKNFTTITDADWQRIWDTNVMSGVRLSRHYLPKMLAANWGRILFISSESAVNIPVEMIHYGVTKTAQVAVARGLAETTTGTGVTVNSILAGPTRSEGVERFVKELATSQGVDEATFEREFFSKVRPSSLLKRFASPDEVANLVAYVCSPRSSATNGAALRVEGGVIRSIL